MSWSLYARFTILSLLAFPIFYILWQRLLPPPHLSANIWIVYFAIICSGPLLLIYAFVMRLLWKQRRLSWVALLVGGPWVGFEVITIIKTLL